MNAVNADTFPEQVVNLFKLLQSQSTEDTTLNNHNHQPITVLSTEWKLQLVSSEDCHNHRDRQPLQILIGKQNFYYPECDRCNTVIGLANQAEPDDADEVTVIPKIRPSHKLLANLCYHDIWQAPILCFNLYHVDDCGFSFSEVQRYLQHTLPIDSSREAIEKLAVISQCEHPLFSAPTYYVHPCNTQTLLARLRMVTETVQQRPDAGGDGDDNPTEVGKNGQLLLFWFSIVSQLIGLRVDIKT